MPVNQGNFLLFDSFEGLNNKSKESSLPPNVLREAVDVDLDRDGKLSSRRGYSAPVVATTLGHSLWGHEQLAFGLYADGGTLYAFLDGDTEELATGLSPGLPISYALVNDQVLWSNGVQRGQVSLALENRDWSCPSPDGQPNLSPVGNGGLSGTVQVCVTFLDVLGRESGATVAAAIKLATPGGVLITGIPQPQDPARVPRVRIYATAADGDTLLHVTTLPAGITEYTMLAAPTGRAIATQFLHQMPAGHIVRKWNARQLVARENILFWSPALRYGMVHPGHGYMRFSHRIDLLEPVGEGLAGTGVYVAAGKRTYFLAGPEPAQWSQAIANMAGAVPGTSCEIPASAWGIEAELPLPAWLSGNGQFVVGNLGGTVTVFNRDSLAVGVGESGASLFREVDGLSQLITRVRGATVPRAGIGDTAIAKVYRH